mmetsp:Transcript_137468/g.239001  ORF Transcript_137468/g.239001 Transcript_137468/m.239001 type:complete len:138 (+) Transcript_137468:78-491(+)
MSSGISVDDAVAAKFNELKLKHTLKWFIMKIQDKKQVIVEAEGDSTSTYDAFLASMPKEQPRYAVVDVEYETDDGRKQEKVAFISYCPDDGPGVKDKMIHSSTLDAVKKKFTGLAKALQCTDWDEISFDNVVAELKK